MVEKDKKELIAVFREKDFYLDFEEYGTKKIDGEFQEKLYKEYLDNSYKMVFNMGFCRDTTKLSESMGFLYDLANSYIKELTKTPEIELLRERFELNHSRELIDEVMLRRPYAIGMNNIDEGWISSAFRSMDIVFQEEIGRYEGSVASYLLERNDKLSLAGRVYFHLVESREGGYPFAFLATYSKVREGGRKAVHLPLKNALEEFKGDQDKLLSLLSTVSRAVKSSDFISEIVESGEIFKPLKLDAEEAYTFLREVETYEECGVLCRIPNWWKKKSGGFRISIGIGKDKPSKVGLDNLMSFDPALYLGDSDITIEELRELMEGTEGLKLIKGKWIEVDHDKLKRTLEAYEKAQQMASDGFITMNEAMRMQLDIEDRLLIDEDIDIDVERGEWLETTLEKLRNPDSLSDVETSEDFKAVLRHYQVDGLKWLDTMTNYGFGACLADDMGLGKTVQVIALMDVMSSRGKIKSLLVVPASLMGNWQKEIERFLPKTNYKMIFNKKDMVSSDDMEQYDMVITTYGMASRIEELQNIEWNMLMLDEAQAIKNPATKRTKAIKNIKADGRIALTGTPIENNLVDLWSIFDFLNRGLLGNLKEFKHFIKQINEEHSDYDRLRKMISPFILRRLKSDKSIVDDLPDKVEIKTYSGLSKKQVVLYNKVLNDLTTAIEEAEGIQRKGLVLGSIMKFKQICNHPDHYSGQGEFKISHSGKFETLDEICKTIHEKREKLLVFTQFREMTDPLMEFLGKIFQKKGLVIHGGTPVKKRGEIVERFQNDDLIPFMVLSLKAGGVGLNLTAANHVVHFDRWWNPAVENQATDRAFRIGQDKNVMVHKLIAKGTIEEKIDEMIDEKTALSDDVIGKGGEAWITELGNNELLEMFSLKI